MVPDVSREHLPQLEKIQEVLPSRRDEPNLRGGVSRLITPNLWNFQRVLHSLTATQAVPRHTRLLSRRSTRVLPTSRGAPFPPHSSRGGILSLRVRERIPGVPVASQEGALSTGKARGTPGSCHHSQSPPDVSVHSRENCFPCTDSTFKPRINSHHGGTWDSPVEKHRGKPRGKASRESHRSLDPCEGKRDTAVTARDESARACPHSRRGLTTLGKLQKYPKIHVSTGEESSGSGTQGLRPRYRRERNPERPPSNSHGDWPFLRPPERVPESPS